MKPANVPFNIRLLQLTPDKTKMIKPVTSLDIFDQTRVNFHEDGLYSVSIFGKLGDPLRNKRFSYIDIKMDIFHPVVYRSLNRLKTLYTEIMEGTAYAIWDATLKDFVRSTKTEGETGYAFFLKHWRDINFPQNSSITRIENIELIKKYGDKAMTSKVVVMPAGLREVEYENDRIVEDEINDFYRRLLSVSNTITDSTLKSSPELLNRSRVSLQKAFNELYAYIERMLEGKKKFIQAKWASTKVFNATRNVITAMPSMTHRLGMEDNPDINTCQVGLYQLLKANLPVSKYLVKNGFLRKVFQDPTAPVTLVNKKTLQTEQLNISPKYYDIFMTDEGLDKLFNLYGEESMRHKPVEIEGRYLGLIYKGPDGTFKLFSDINELPAGRLKEHVTPITYTELLYCSVYMDIERYPGVVVRYPITGVGSCRMSKVRLQVTVDSESRIELGDDWLRDDSRVARRFPISGAPFVNALSPPSYSLQALGADAP